MDTNLIFVKELFQACSFGHNVSSASGVHLAFARRSGSLAWDPNDQLRLVNHMVVMYERDIAMTSSGIASVACVSTFWFTEDQADEFASFIRTTKVTIGKRTTLYSRDWSRFISRPFSEPFHCLRLLCNLILEQWFQPIAKKGAITRFGHFGRRTIRRMFPAQTLSANDRLQGFKKNE
jgi:hypothetical protein